MEYSVLTIGLPDALFVNLKNLVTQYRLRFIMSSTVQEAARLINRQSIHLLIIDLEYLRSIHQSDWLAGIRRNTFAPVIILSDFPERDLNRMVHLGADICVSGKWPYCIIADLIYAQLRRYTEYSYDGHYPKNGRAGARIGASSTPSWRTVCRTDPVVP